MVEFTFSGGEGYFYLILEMYAGGNIILTDSNYTILALLRGHKFDDDVRYGKGEVYPFEYAANMTFSEEPISIEQVETAISEARASEQASKRKSGTNLKMLISKLCPYMHPALAEHCLKAAGIV